jgi:hypothetical protein
MDYLRPLPPRFWSIRMYNGLTRYSVPNPINRYSLGSDNDLKKNADGSFTLFRKPTARDRTRNRTGSRPRRDRSTFYSATMHPCPKSQKVCAILPPLWGRIRWCRFPRGSLGVFERIGREYC